MIKTGRRADGLATGPSSRSVEPAAPPQGDVPPETRTSARPLAAAAGISPTWVQRAQAFFGLRALLAAVSLFPLALCIWSGALGSSLWLDEITYHYLETDVTARAVELGRPGSRIAPHLSIFSYCDLQRALHSALDLTAAGRQVTPEASARALSLASAILVVLLAYAYGLRRTGSDVQALAAALVVSSTPLLLHYAFEGRVYAFAALSAVAYLWASRVALRSGGWWVALAALLGAVMQRANWWLICIPLALACWGAGTAVWQRSLSRWHGRLLAVLAPALAIGTAEYLFVTRVAGDAAASPFPLFLPRGILTAFRFTSWTAFVPSGASMAAPPAWVGHAGTALVLLLVLLSFRGKSREELPVAPICLMALVISALAGGHFGAIVFGRHQVGMVVGLLFGLGASGGRTFLVGRVALISLNLAFLPNVIDVMNAKGNGRSIATLLRARSAEARSPALVVEHTLRLGYPDPLNSIGADFYLNVRPGHGPPLPIYELPDHRPVAGQRGVYRYFNGGSNLLSRFESRPAEEWQRWLQSCSHDVIWFVYPDPGLKSEFVQAASYREALREAGYTASRSSAYRLSAYPASIAEKFVRR